MTDTNEYPELPEAHDAIYEITIKLRARAPAYMLSPEAETTQAQLEADVREEKLLDEAFVGRDTLEVMLHDSCSNFVFDKREETSRFGHYQLVSWDTVKTTEVVERIVD